jgi:hypothetical protein
MECPLKITSLLFRDCANLLCKAAIGGATCAVIAGVAHGMGIHVPSASSTFSEATAYGLYGGAAGTLGGFLAERVMWTTSRSFMTRIRRSRLDR